MATSFMEMIYIDDSGDARKTDMERACETAADTWAEFNSYRRFSVDIKQAKFLLDYHNRKGDLADTIALDVGGFAAITGRRPLSDAAYRKIDRDFWNVVRSDHKHAA